MTDEVKLVPGVVLQDTMESLKAEMMAALSDGHDDDVIAIGGKMRKFKADVEKVAIARLEKEAEALSGDREKLAGQIHTSLKSGQPVEKLNDRLESVKATGFTYKLDDGDVKFKSVALTVPTIKKRSGGGGGSTGALKAQTGLSRHEIIDQYATAEEKQVITDAEAGADKRPDSARYIAEKPVIKRILADHSELIKR